MKPGAQARRECTRPTRAQATRPTPPAEAAPDAAWRIEKLVPGGEGFARLPDGRAGFAGGVAPGDLIEPTTVRPHKGYVRAEAFRLVEPSAVRVAPPCRIAARCGGCDWMHLDLGAQREHKRTLVLEALRRTGGFKAVSDVELVTAGPDLGYRRRLRMHADDTGRIGFYAPRSHDLVEVTQCLVADDAVNRALAALREVLARRPDTRGTIEAVEIRSAPDEPRVAVSLFPRRGIDGAVLHALAEALSAHASVSIAGSASERAVQHLPLGDRLSLHAPPGVFTQVNWHVNRRVIADVVDETRRRGAMRALDLFAGAGNFTLPLAEAKIAVLGVEQDPRAVRAARMGADAAGLRVRFRHADATREARSLVRSGERFDLIVLDPPRTGAGDAIDDLAALAQRSIVYVSCDPVTLARDLRRLGGHGFALDTVRAYDMFPHTHHAETVAWMSRRG